MNRSLSQFHVILSCIQTDVVVWCGVSKNEEEEEMVGGGGGGGGGCSVFCMQTVTYIEFVVDRFHCNWQYSAQMRDRHTTLEMGATHTASDTTSDTASDTAMESEK